MTQGPRPLVIFAELSPANLPAALWFSLLRRRVIFIEPKGAFRNDDWISRLASLGIEWADYHTFPKLPLSFDLKILGIYATRLIDTLFSEADLETFAAVVPQANLDVRKARSILHEDIVSRLRPLSQAYGLAEYFRERGIKSSVFLRIGIGGLLMAVGRPTLIDNRYPGLALSFLLHVFGKISSRLTHVILRLIKIRPAAPTDVAASAGTGTSCAGANNEEVSHDIAPILFFPHFGPVYAQLFQKDQFYSNDHASPFHHSRIQHVELSWMLSESERAFIRNRYERLGTPVTFLELTQTRSLSSILSMFRDVLRRTKGSARFLRAAMISMNGLRMKNYLQTFAGFKGAKIALLGYDILFPVAATAALQANGVRVAALQERYIHAFYDSYTVAVDDYFVHGDLIKRQYLSNPNCAIGNLIVTGDPRREKIRQHRARALEERSTRFKNYMNVCLILDFHTQPDRYTNSFSFWTDARSNFFFYSHIANLAEANPDTAFVIRGKDTTWCDLPEMQPAMIRFGKISNIFIDNQYATFDRSYELSAMADLVIARYTSLCDQCLAEGIPVLIYEAMPNHGRLISTWLDYGPYPVMVHNEDELHSRFQQTVREGRFMDSADFVEMRRDFYHVVADPDDMPPSKLIQQHLTKMFDEMETGTKPDAGI